MRTIEENMVAAIRASKNWRSGNTVFKDGCVYLHGNCIACGLVGDFSSVAFTFAGWKTATTASRLRALAYAFNLVPEDTSFRPSRAKSFRFNPRAWYSMRSASR